jgi:hypothetical protein
MPFVLLARLHLISPVRVAIEDDVFRSANESVQFLPAIFEQLENIDAFLDLDLDDLSVDFFEFAFENRNAILKACFHVCSAHSL